MISQEIIRKYINITAMHNILLLMKDGLVE